MDRTFLAYLILVVMIAVGIAAGLYYGYTSRGPTDRRRIRREDSAWNVRRAELGDDDAAPD